MCFFMKKILFIRVCVLVNPIVFLITHLELKDGLYNICIIISINQLEILLTKQIETSNRRKM
jgi:hypothetical protein